MYRFYNITNFEIQLLFLAAGFLEDKAFRKGLINVYIFHQTMLCLKQDDFKITLRNERKVRKDYIKASLVRKIAFCFEILHKISQFFSYIEFVPSAVLSQTNYLEQKRILSGP